MISPIDNRYFGTDTYKKCDLLFSDERWNSYKILVEEEFLKEVLIEKGEIKEGENLDFDAIFPLEVQNEEKVTHHDIKALVNVFKRKVPERYKKYVHLGLTSSDIVETANSLRLKSYTDNLLIPSIRSFLGVLQEFIRANKEVKQIARTHGQHAVPITVGYSFSEYYYRVENSLRSIRSLKEELQGKISGAVGTGAGLSLVVEDPHKLEKRVLDRLDLKQPIYSTQILDPQPVLRLLLEFNILFTAIANMADDMRNLQRTEIGEIGEVFYDSQVGSSTMPQKKNPWKIERIKSLWKESTSSVNTWFMDAISDHQRDLTSSSSSRYRTEYLFNLLFAINSMTSIIDTLYVDIDRTEEKVYDPSVYAEAAYIILSLRGEEDSHEMVRKASLQGKDILEEFSISFEEVNGIYTEAAIKKCKV